MAAKKTTPQKVTQNKAKAKNKPLKKEEVVEIEVSRLNALELIAAEKLKPKSEVRTTGKRFLPLAVGGFFALCSGFAIYGAVSAVRFYAGYGDSYALFWSIILLFALLALVGLSALVVHRSEWGYRFRFIVIMMIILGTSVGGGAVLMQAPAERLIEKLGLVNSFRTEDRLLNESAVYGRLIELRKDGASVRLLGGGIENIEITSLTRFFPRGVQLRVGQGVAIVLETDGNSAKWIRVLPSDHPAGRVKISD